ncbi:MAG: YaiI/YqxD family protein [Chromatiales bacterium]|nr:YaiI/YqxD family protein [Chromatiales bacterium]
MTIWVDADACPNTIKEVLFRAAERTQTELVLVANQPLRTPPSRLISTIQVGAGFDVADNLIVQRLDTDDLVITADIPLAAEVVAKSATAINPRGEHYTTENIRERLAMRDLMQTLRDTGQASGGPPPFNKQDVQAFANSLDRWLAQH